MIPHIIASWHLLPCFRWSVCEFTHHITGRYFLSHNRLASYFVPEHTEGDTCITSTYSTTHTYTHTYTQSIYRYSLHQHSCVHYTHTFTHTTQKIHTTHVYTPVYKYLHLQTHTTYHNTLTHRTQRNTYSSIMSTSFFLSLSSSDVSLVRSTMAEQQMVGNPDTQNTCQETHRTPVR